jgi:hypothetical protein
MSFLAEEKDPFWHATIQLLGQISSFSAAVARFFEFVPLLFCRSQLISEIFPFFSFCLSRLSSRSIAEAKDGDVFRADVGKTFTKTDCCSLAHSAFLFCFLNLCISRQPLHFAA